MPKVPKIEESKLSLLIPEPEQVASNIEIKSPTLSPRVTRKTAAFLTMSELDLNTLFKFVKCYDGSRDTLNSFLVNCDNAYDLASESQKHILFKYILSQLNGKAEIACSIKEFSTWEQLKEFLKAQFSERKHYSHLLTDLQESRQGTQENVGQYALRVETYLSQLLTEISFSNTKAKELPGRTAAMEDLALHHFLMGLNPRIATIVRCRNPKTLNDAINLAISEEKIMQVTSRRTPPVYNPSQNRNQNANSYQRQYQPASRAFPQRGITAPQRPTYQSASSFTTYPAICRYCKAPGHTIDFCRKREFNNRKFNNQPGSHTNNNNNNNTQGRTWANQPIHPILSRDEGRDEVDNSHLNTIALPSGIVQGDC